jgi:hypothetical protein
MTENALDLWPCLGEVGLQVFATTADQRYLLGEDLFLMTHFPITLRHFPPDRPPEGTEEANLLERLTHTGGVQPGNRVFVLYGAAGSGKSELMRWLQVMVARHDPARAEVTVRIPRTELDVLRIAEQFQHLLSQTYFSETTRRRWEEARRKPRTLSKLLLLSALERCLDSDEQINALYYRLLDWIHPRIARSLAAMDDAGPDLDNSGELLTREDLDQLKTETALPVPLDYEQFRHHLLTAFRDHLMEGLHLPDTLGRIAEDMARRGVRPVLLIDDLVQSVNLFATDLLDYFITLDSGNWDVVVGLTPAALAESNRGRELLDRISYLDTMDDRVEKLWLSDIRGHDSYFLTEKNCAAFAAGYLEAYRARNGWSCEACPEQDRCAGLDSNNEGTLLVPFNEALLQRLFRGLPNGKGKARYFLRHLREILAAASNSGDLLTTLKCYARLDTAAEADDETLARVAELYGPPASDHQVTLPAALMVAFGEPAQPVTLPAEPLRRRRLFLEPLASSEPLTDPGRAAIKAWLDGEPANRQSLLQLRKGIARWLRVFCPVEELYAPGVACPHQALRWRKVYLGIRPPIILQGADDGEGIFVTQDIGLAAFRLYEYATATGDERKTLTASLAQEERLIPILYAAADYRQQAMERLEDQLGMEIEELALGLYTWLAIAHGPLDERPPGFGEDFWDQVKTTRAQIPVWRSEPDEALCEAICHLFEDFFKLRKNVYNGSQIARLIDARAPDTLLETLTQVDPDRLDRDYRLSRKPLCAALAAVQANVRRWNRPDDAEYDLSPAAKAVLEVLLERDRDGVPLSQVPAEVWEELRTTRQDVYGALKVRLVIE